MTEVDIWKLDTKSYITIHSAVCYDSSGGGGARLKECPWLVSDTTYGSKRSRKDILVYSNHPGTVSNDESVKLRQIGP